MYIKKLIEIFKIIKINLRYNMLPFTPFSSLLILMYILSFTNIDFYTYCTRMRNYINIHIKIRDVRANYRCNIHVLIKYLWKYFTHLAT